MRTQIITDETITLVDGATPYVVSAGQPEYAAIIEALVADDWDRALLLASRPEQIRRSGLEAVGLEIRDGAVYWEGEQITGYLVNKILETTIRGGDVTPLVNFFVELQKNPSYRMVQGLFHWVERGGMTITPKGMIVGYKKVRADYTDIHSGTMDNSIGARPFKPRNAIDDEPNKTCAASGLHFCSKGYLANFSSSNASTDRIMILEISPADVVSFPPNEEAKGRASTYLVVDEVPRDTCPDEYVRAGLRANSTFVSEPTNRVYDNAPTDDSVGAAEWTKLDDETRAAMLNCLAEVEDLIHSEGPNLPARIRAAERALGIHYSDEGLNDWASRIEEIHDEAVIHGNVYGYATTTTTITPDPKDTP